MKLILNIIIISSILFGKDATIESELTDEQLKKIRAKTEDVLLTPNFTLKSLESRNFSDIKSQIKTVSEECKLWKTAHKDFPSDVQEMIDEKFINIPDSILKKWTFDIDLKFDKKSLIGTITASAVDEDIKLVYDVEKDIFSFITPFEANMSFDSSITLDSLRGKVVLINFWATWCGPCRLEIPDFNELYKQYNEYGLEILAISISDSREALLKFKNAYNIFYPILYDNQYEMSKIQREYGVHSIPISFLLDKYGEVIRVYPGAILKQFDPSMYTDLVMNIENALLK